MWIKTASVFFSQVSYSTLQQGAWHQQVGGPGHSVKDVDYKLKLKQFNVIVWLIMGSASLENKQSYSSIHMFFKQT